MNPFFQLRFGVMTLLSVLMLLAAFPCDAQRKGYRKGIHTNEYPDGSSYTGEWKDFLFHGQGTYKYVNGDEYTGEWKEGKPDGEGTLTQPDGSTYTGSWKRARKTATGCSNMPKETASRGNG